METDATPNLNISITICKYCRGEIRQGSRDHDCTVTSRRRNISEHLKTASQGTLETVTGAALKEVERRQQELAGPDGSREVSLQSGFGGACPLKVTIGGKRKKQPRQLSNDDLLKIRKQLGLSSVKTKQLASMIRVGTNNRKAVEPGLAEALVESNRTLDDLFTSEAIQLENKKGEVEEKILVFCNDVEELVVRVMEHRELDENQVDIKLGLDGGQGSLKVTLSVMEKDERVMTGRQTYADGVGVKEQTSGSVNKLMVLALMQEAPETYQTVKIMMEKLNLENFPVTITSDIKMLLLLIGKCGGNLTYGCVFCSSSKPLTEAGNLYTLSHLQAHHQQFLAAGGDKKKQREFNNVVNEPLLGGDPDDFILCSVAPPELHLMLGVTDKLKKILESSTFETAKEGKDFMDTFLDEQNISRKGYMDSRSLEGNQTRKFLKSTNKLREAYKAVGKEKLAEPIINILDLFSNVVTKCFGMYVEDGYKDTIDRFSSAYMELHQEKPETFTVTPKIHIVMHHVAQYLNLMESEQENHGLGYLSEQAFEAVHSDMKAAWENGWKVSTTHKEFSAKLRKFVVAYNSNNM